jgi:hypothetical protein
MIDLRNKYKSGILQRGIRRNVPGPDATSMSGGCAAPWRRGSVPEIIDHRNRLYCGNKAVRPVRTRFHSSPPAAGTVQVLRSYSGNAAAEYECDFETALFGAYYRVSIRDAEAEGCPCDCP